MVEAEAAGALWALSEGHDANKVSIAGAGAVPTLTGLLACPNERAQKHAASALASLALGKPDNQSEVASLLTQMLATGADPTQHRVAKALWRVVQENAETQHVIAKSSGALWGEHSRSQHAAPQIRCGSLNTPNLRPIPHAPQRTHEHPTCAPYRMPRNAHTSTQPAPHTACPATHTRVPQPAPHTAYPAPHASISLLDATPPQDAAPLPPPGCPCTGAETLVHLLRGATRRPATAPAKAYALWSLSLCIDETNYQQVPDRE